MEQSIFLQTDYKIICVFISTRGIYWISKTSSDRKTELIGSSRMSQESIKHPTTSDIIFAPKLISNYQFNPIQDGLFWDCSRAAEGGKAGVAKKFPSLKSVTHILQQ